MLTPEDKKWIRERLAETILAVGEVVSSSCPRILADHCADKMRKGISVVSPLDTVKP